MKPPPQSIWIATMFWSQNATAWLGCIEQFESGRASVQHELTWTGYTPRAAAVDIHKLLKAEKITTEYNLLDPEQFPQIGSSGESVAETFGDCGFPCIEGHKDLGSGLSRLRSWFEVIRWPDGLDAPGLTIHKRCQHLIRTLPSLMSHPEHPDRLIETVDTYATKALCSWAMSRPMPATPIEIPPPAGSLYYDVAALRRAASE
jgi:hypothetical protein